MMGSVLMFAVPVVTFFAVIIFDAPIGYQDRDGFHYGEPDDGE